MFRVGPFLSRALRRPIQQRRQDGFLNLHHIGNPKQIDQYLENDRAKHFVQDTHGSYWGHPVMSIDLAREISPDFANKTNLLLYKYISGSDPDPLGSIFQTADNRLWPVSFWDREKPVEEFDQDHYTMHVHKLTQWRKSTPTKLRKNRSRGSW